MIALPVKPWPCTASSASGGSSANAVSGGSAAPTQAGYVIGPGESVSIGGWRKSLEHTAAFVFTTPSQSCAAKTHRRDDIGVIGVALFRRLALQIP